MGATKTNSLYDVHPGVAMHYTMGGIWVNNEDQATSVPGIYAAGECEYQYHGANRLGANSLVSCIFGGGLAGPTAVKYVRGLEKGTEAVDSGVFAREQKRQEDRNQALIAQDGAENPITIWKELGEIMTEHDRDARVGSAGGRPVLQSGEASFL